MDGQAFLTNKWPSNGASIVRPPSSLSVLGVVYKKNLSLLSLGFLASRDLSFFGFRT